jgi:hypothetical protein
MLEVLLMRAEPIQALQNELSQFVLQTQGRLVQLRQQLLEGRGGNWGPAMPDPSQPLSATRTNNPLGHKAGDQAQDRDACWPEHRLVRPASAPEHAGWQGDNWCGEMEASSNEAAARVESSSLDRLAAIKQRLAEQIKSL